MQKSNVASVPSTSRTSSTWSRRIGILTVATTAITIVVALTYALTSNDNSSFKLQPVPVHSEYPTGIPDAAEPSGDAPPGPNGFNGYKLTYVSDFAGTSLPATWFAYTGQPAGDPGGQFASSHVVVSHGLLELNTWKDPAYQQRWITGGLCQCGLPKTFGAYFVRSKITGGGPNEVQLLWPSSNTWPPEIDFNENDGNAGVTSSTIHWGPINQIDQRFINIDMEQWHTWGLIWSPHSVIYTVDGQVWGKITNASEIAHVPMVLDFEQLQHCQSGWECPSKPTSMDIDWIAEYSPK